MFEHLIPSHNINLYAVNGHLSFQGRFSGCALRTTEIVIPQKAWKSGDGKFMSLHLPFEGKLRLPAHLGHCSSLVKLQLSLMISLIPMTPRTIYRVSFGSFQLTSACGGVQCGDNRNFWVNQRSQNGPIGNINDLHENAWINSDLMSFSSCVFTLLNGYFEAFWMESFYIQSLCDNFAHPFP